MTTTTELLSIKMIIIRLIFKCWRMERELRWTLIFRNPVPSGHKELPILMLDILLEVKQPEVLLHQDMEENLLSRSNTAITVPDFVCIFLSFTWNICIHYSILKKIKCVKNSLK